jgi:hypothetical protein
MYAVRAFPHYFGNGAWAFEIGNFRRNLGKTTMERTAYKLC